MSDASLARVEPALAGVEAVLQRVAEHGLQRATGATLAELRGVSQQAHHARLVRLERELDTLVTLLERYLERDPLFRPRQWVAGCNRSWLLVGAIRRALAEAADVTDLEAVAGTPRRRYEPVNGLLDVQVVAADGWVTDTGFVGVTVHLRCPGDGRWLQASMVRPQAMVGPVPTRLVRFPVSDAFPLSVQELAHGSWTLDDVRLSADGRISLHRGLVAIPAPPGGRRALEPLWVASAAGILDRLLEAELDPVRGIGSALVYLEPIAFGAVHVDETQAVATTHVSDGAGARIGIRIPLKPENDLLIDNLERLGGDWRPDGLVARAWLARGELQVHPLSAVYVEPVRLRGLRGPVHEVHLSLEALESAGR